MKTVPRLRLERTTIELLVGILCFDPARLLGWTLLFLGFKLLLKKVLFISIELIENLSTMHIRDSQFGAALKICNQWDEN